MIRKRLSTATLVALAVVFVSAIAPAAASAITRDTAIARGKVWLNYTWVDPKTGATRTSVPYSQAKWALESGAPVPTSTPSPSIAGYRTDCSGFVSMCWNLRDGQGRPYSSSTWEFGNNNSSLYKIRQISKGELQPGDMLLASAKWGAKYPHAIIFAGWSKPDMSEYWALEQTTSSSHDGTVLRTRPYGQAYYRPFRLEGIEEDFADCQTRVTGADRYSTAAAASNAAFPASTTASVPALVIASGENWPDALGGAALSGAVRGPLLLTAAKTLPAATAAEIVRLKPGRIYVLGGEPTVSSTVVSKIAGVVPGTPITRVGGPNRYDVAASVGRIAVGEARAKGSVIETAFVATGLTFPDALAASPLSAKTAYPILLTKPNALMPAPAAALRDLKIKNVVILGGPASVSPTVEAALAKQGYKVTRIADANRYSTAIKIARFGAGMGVGLKWDEIGVASGAAFADALSGGAAQGQTGSLLVLTPGGSLDPGVRALIAENHAAIQRARVFGGIKTITQNTRAALAGVLRTGQ